MRTSKWSESRGAHRSICEETLRNCVFDVMRRLDQSPRARVIWQRRAVPGVALVAGTRDCDDNARHQRDIGAPETDVSDRIVCLGEVLLRLSAPGRELLLQSSHLAVCFGGSEANVAVSLARFGHAVAMATVVPDNPLGEAAIGELRRHGVDTSHVLTLPGRMGLYFLVTGAIHRASEVLYDRSRARRSPFTPGALSTPRAC